MRSTDGQGPLGPPDPLQCGRCRATFPGDPDLTLGIDPGWWACEPCRETLLGSGAWSGSSWSRR